MPVTYSIDNVTLFNEILSYRPNPLNEFSYVGSFRAWSWTGGLESVEEEDESVETVETFSRKGDDPIPSPRTRLVSTVTCQFYVTRLIYASLGHSLVVGRVGTL